VSRWLEAQTREVFAYDGSIHVLPNFVDCRRFLPREGDDVRRELGGDRHPLIVHMSNFRSLKRVADTVDVLHRLGPASRARLVLVGNGPDEPLVRERAQRLGLADRVEFLGEIENVECVVSAADVALFPSESESFGLSALEAMACGVPVVATDVGGLPDTVVHGETGFLHSVGDTAGMAASVGRLLGDEALRAAMGRAGVERACRMFSLPAMLERHEQLYASLLEAP
jgi:N-acetyl-alpha-D-glucosaminyl L-malate synthase BshA